MRKRNDKNSKSQDSLASVITTSTNSDDGSVGSGSGSGSNSNESWGRKKRPSGMRMPSSDIKARLHVLDNGRVKISAPGTPWDEINLSETFIEGGPRHGDSSGFFFKRRLFFVIGGLLGAFFGWLFTEGSVDIESTLAAARLSIAELDVPSISSLTLPSLSLDLRSIARYGINLTELTTPTRSWFEDRSFVVGREAKAKGLQKKHAVVLVPGIVSSGLESWGTDEEVAPFFRKRLWGTTSMMRAMVTRKEQWMKAMLLDPHTGLDPPGVKIRSAQGLDAASYFITGYWIWSKIIENLAVLDYDFNDLHLAAYDWRLSYYNLQVRDKYFSRLKFHIEHNLQFMGKKTVIVGHSMGSLVVLYFLKWVEADQGGNGGPEWCEKHIAGYVNVAGTLLGVPKAMSALLSGEMRDTVELNPAAVALLERVLSRKERAKLFRSWVGSASMWLKGGDEIWGTHDGAPDDPPNANLTFGNVYYFRKPGTTEISETVQPNMTMEEGQTFLLQNTPATYQRMLASNYSWGFEKDPKTLESNDHLHTKWTNPLEIRLPNAPSMKMYCLYGHGKDTERAYWYRYGGYEYDEGRNGSVCMDPKCDSLTKRPPLDMPLQRKVWVDTSVVMEDASPQVRSGVLIGEGDGTVSVLSLGAMCVDGWKPGSIYNPANISVITHEIKHEPQAFDPRGGPTSSDHIDILGSTELNEALLNIVTGHEDEVTEQFHSRIKEYSGKIKWPVA